MKQHFPTSGFRLLGLFILLPAVLATSNCQERNLMIAAYPPNRLKQSLPSYGGWHPYPTASERSAWASISPALRREYSRRGEEALTASWPKLTDSLYQEYWRTGIRLTYDRLYQERRRLIQDLVLAECFEYRGRFLGKIEQGIRLLFEEPTWVVPAHLGPLQPNDSRPDRLHPVVDLYSGETGNLLAWTRYLLGNELARVAPDLNDRIESELKARILDPNLHRDDFWWMWTPGRKQPGRTINNWTPWICSNWLAICLLTERDEEVRFQTISKITVILDRFLNSYPDDGGVDEGPNYWNHSVGSLYESIVLLESATGSRSSLLSEPLIAEMARYIYRAHVNDDYFVTVSDSHLKISFPSSFAVLMGREIHDDNLAGLGAALTLRQAVFNIGIRGSMTRQLMFLFNVALIRSQNPKQPLLTDVWLPQSHFFAAREKENSPDGFYVSAQGLHNGKSHNHNDVGNFLLYLDGSPFIIDVGPEGYNARTFSGDRYKIWTMQSAYHNLPTINGVMQREGREYAARGVRYRSGKDSAIFSLDIAGAYPAEAQVEEWVRTIKLDRTKGEVVVTEDYALNDQAKDLTLTLMTSGRVVSTEAGRIVVRVHSEAKEGQTRDVVISFDADKLRPTVETIRIEDKELRAEWNTDLQRILLRAAAPPKRGTLTVSFRRLSK